MKVLSEQNFNDFINGGDCMVQFSAVWCGPCKTLTKTLTEAGELAVPMGKIDIDQAPGIASRFAIRSVPALIVFRGGEEVSRSMGSKPLSKIETFLKESLV